MKKHEHEWRRDLSTEARKYGTRVFMVVCGVEGCEATGWEIERLDR